MIRDLLKVKNYGVLELLVASLIILTQYSLGPIPMSFFLCPLMAFIGYRKTRRVWRMRPYILLVGYIILHDILLFFTMSPVPSYHFNNLVSMAVFLISTPFIIPALDYRKLVRSIALVGIICSLGILYHFILLRAVPEVHTIRIPLFPASSLAQGAELTRPTSFFTEPSYYGIFMMVPVFLSLVYKKYWITAFSVGMVFLSTTITGVVGCVCIISVYFLSKKENRFISLIILPIVVAIMGYALINFQFFRGTSSKLENQINNIETVDRVYNGILLFDKIEKEYLIFGVNNANCSDYVIERHLQGSLIPLSEDSNLIYLSSFWEILFNYGIIGMILYMSIYMIFFKKERTLSPYIANAILSMFYGGDGLLTFYMFSIAFMAVYARDYKNVIID